jgi:hypothetical protein
MRIAVRLGFGNGEFLGKTGPTLASFSQKQRVNRCTKETLVGTQRRASGWHAICQEEGNGGSTHWLAVASKKLDWMVCEMNRWMKRRIERSRARCERSSLRQQLSNENSIKKNLAGAPSRKEDKK